MQGARAAATAFGMSTSPVDESQLRALIDAVDRADAQGRPDEAARLLRSARSMAPEHPVALAAGGVHALRIGHAAEARALFERAIAADPANPGLYLNLASSLREACPHFAGAAATPPPSSAASVAAEGGRSLRSRALTISVCDITLNRLPPATLARSASLHPRRASSCSSAG